MWRATYVLPIACGLVVLASALGAPLAPQPRAKRFVMPWLCLERCGGTPSTVKSNVEQLAVHRASLTAASFELYNLGAEGTLVVNNLTDVAPALEKLGLVTYPMISSYPYPPQFLSWMRQVFAQPDAFIQHCVAEAQRRGHSGFNVDWEPTNATVGADDPRDYADFLTKFAAALHEHGMTLSVDVATWSPLWNYTLLGASGVDYVCTMSTYTDNDASFRRQLATAVAEIPLSKLVVGLETVKATGGGAYNVSEVDMRFRAIEAAGVRAIALWKNSDPVPDLWWPYIDAFASGAPLPTPPV